MKNVILISLCLFMFSCQAPEVSEAEKQANFENVMQGVLKKHADSIGDQTKFIHTVYVWLKKDLTEEQKVDFKKNGLEKLKEISSIYRCYIGPAANTPREVVDNSYDYAMVFHFASSEDHDKYQVDPIHVKFIEDYKGLWERIQIYDNLVSE